MTRQKILLSAVAAIVCSLIFAPMALFGESGIVASCGFRFLTSPGVCNPERYQLARVDYVVLFTYWAGIAIIGCLLSLRVKPKVDTAIFESNISTLESELRRLARALDSGDIDFAEYDEKKTAALLRLIDNQTTLKAVQALGGALPEAEMIRRVHISPGQLAGD